MLGLWVAVAAGVGALARYVVDELIEHRTRSPFPTGTFIVNLTGSFVLGLVTGLVLHHGLGRDASAILGVGFAGGYTTFSTWAWESLALTEDGLSFHAAANVLGSLTAGFVAAMAGLGLALL